MASSNISNSKSDFYTSAKGYRDDDGMSRNFDFIDYTPKTKIHMTNLNKEDIKKQLEDYRKSVINKILNIPAVYCPGPFADFVIRGADVERVAWNESMLNDEGLPLNRLTDLYTIMNNRVKIETKTY